MKIGLFTFTRDSVWWGVSAFLSFVAVLATLTDTSGPMSLAYYGIPASWLPYIRLLALVNTWVSGKMSTSPAPSSNEVARGIRDSGRPLALLLAVGLSAAMLSTGCASARHKAVVTVASAHTVLTIIREDELLLVCGRATAPAPPLCVPPEVHRDISAKLVKAFEADERMLRIVRATPSSAGPADVGTLLREISGVVSEILALIPASHEKAAIVGKVGAR